MRRRRSRRWLHLGLVAAVIVAAVVVGRRPKHANGADRAWPAWAVAVTDASELDGVELPLEVLGLNGTFDVLDEPHPFEEELAEALARTRALVRTSTAELEQPAPTTSQPRTTTPTATVHVQAKAELIGRVVSVADEPQAGALVRLIVGRKSFAEVRTEVDGTFRFANLQAGRYAVFARQRGFIDGQVTRVDLPPGQVRTDVLVVLEESGTIRGTVRTKSKEPVRGARVRMKTTGAFGTIQVTTDSSGRYRLWGAKPGRNVVSVVHKNYVDPRARTVTLKRNKQGQVTSRRKIDFTLTRGGSITVTVVHPLGIGTGVKVEVFDRRGRRRGRSSTDSAGEARFVGLLRGRYQVVAGPKDGAVARQSVSVGRSGDTQVMVVLEAGAQISGRVIGPDEEPVGGVLIRADRSGFSRRREMRSRSTGGFQFDGLLDGSYRVRAIPTGALVPPPTLTVHIIGGQADGEAIIVLSQGTVVRGRAVAPDGGPAAGATVSAYDRSARLLSSTITGPDGLFVLERLALGPGTLFARQGSEGMREAVVLRAGYEQQFVLQLQPLASARGRVLNGKGKPLRNIWVGATSVDKVVRRSVRTDRKGRFTLPSLYPGQYTINARRGTSSQSTIVTASRGSRIDGLQLVLP